MGRNRGLVELFGETVELRRRSEKRIMNDGESFVALFVLGFLGLFCAKHFFLLYKNGNDGDDDDGGVLVCVMRCVHVK